MSNSAAVIGAVLFVACVSGANAVELQADSITAGDPSTPSYGSPHSAQEFKPAAAEQGGVSIFNTAPASKPAAKEHSANDEHAPAQRDDKPSNLPVPASVWLFGSAVLGLAGVARRRHRHVD